MEGINPAQNGVEGRYEIRKDGQVYLRQGALGKAMSAFEQALTRALAPELAGSVAQEVEQGTETTGDSNKGQALAHWALQMMMQAQQRMMSVMQSDGETSFRPRSLPLFAPPKPGLHILENSGTRQVLSNSRQGEGEFSSIIEEAARSHRLPEDLIRAVIRTESGFNPNAKSPVGAQGLMQLMPGTAKTLGVTDAFDPRQNINGGAKYLRMMLDRYDNNLSKALAAYNWGPHRVDKNGLSNMPTETRNYLRIILGNLGVKQGE